MSWGLRDPEGADLRSDLLLSYALGRKGIALEMAYVCAFEAHEQLIELLLSLYLRPSPTGYSNISFTAQIARCGGISPCRVAAFDTGQREKYNLGVKLRTYTCYTYLGLKIQIL